MNKIQTPELRPFHYFAMRLASGEYLYHAEELRHISRTQLEFPGMREAARAELERRENEGDGCCETGTV